MNTNRILKEARPLFWPWCAVVMAGAVPLVRPLQAIDWIAAAGFFLGIPLLATLALGNEFQHRTLSLLLSQPVSRMEIWAEKLSVTVVAVLSAVLVFSFFLRVAVAPYQPDRHALALVGAWIIVIMTSATFWTLFARSTLGGVTLNFGVSTFIIIQWANLAIRQGATGNLSSANTIFVWTVTFALFCYAGVMLWLGRQALAQFQATGGIGSDDLLTAGPHVLPEALAGWFRCRPTGPVLNLIRKELRLLRPVWLISLLAVVGWSCLILYGLVHEPRSTNSFTVRIASANWPIVVWIVGVCSTLMISILAGSLSLGEERTSGTHFWQLTLPVSAFRQWLIKLLMALFAGLVGAWLLPILLLVVGGSLSGLPCRFMNFHFGLIWLCLVVILCLASFWCACAANGTVSAVLWVFPVMFTLGFASDFGGRAGRELIDVVVSRFDPFANLRFTHAVASSFDVRPFWRFAYDDTTGLGGGLGIVLVKALVLVPPALFAIVQSYRLFRAQLPGRTLSVVRSLLPLAMLAFLCGLCLSACYTFVDQATRQEIRLTYDTHVAIEKILSSTATPDATEALQPTVDDLAKAYDGTKTLPHPFAESTRRWLRNSRITVIPNKAHPSDICCGGNEGSMRWWYYVATIHLADGSDLTQSFQPAEGTSKYPHLRTYAHWQGAKGQEEITPHW